jgi:hypothetical protein
MQIDRLVRDRRPLVVLAALGTLAVAASAGAAGGSDSLLPLGKLSHETVIAALGANAPSVPAAKAVFLQAHPTPSLPNAGAAPDAQLVTGIVDVRQAPFPRSTYAIENRWQELRGGMLDQVYAGADGADPTQGVVVLQLVAWPADQDVETQAFPTPTKEGPVRITAADGDLLTLTSESGGRYTFDVVSHALSVAS